MFSGGDECSVEETDVERTACTCTCNNCVC